MEEIEEIEVTEDLYIIPVLDAEYVDLHSRQLDSDGSSGVIVTIDELDKLIEALMQLRKEAEAIDEL